MSVPCAVTSTRSSAIRNSNVSFTEEGEKGGRRQQRRHRTCQVTLFWDTLTYSSVCRHGFIYRYMHAYCIWIRRYISSLIEKWHSPASIYFNWNICIQYKRMTRNVFRLRFLSFFSCAPRNLVDGFVIFLFCVKILSVVPMEHVNNIHEDVHWSSNILGHFLDWELLNIFD